MTSFGRAWRCGNTWNSLHKRRLDCRWSIFYSFFWTTSSYLSCLSYWCTCGMDQSNCYRIFHRFYCYFKSMDCFFSILSVFKQNHPIPLPKTSQCPHDFMISLRKGMNKEALEAEACFGISPGVTGWNMPGEHHILYRGCVFKPSWTSAALLPPLFYKSFPNHRRGKKVSLDDGIMLHCSV